ncbi:MAG TPA: YkgJ family cysteine cluster protein [Anaerolineae bacterium]|nr:YkgJ family cysteine cluster protein [Anaerolineae bacterium]
MTQTQIYLQEIENAPHFDDENWAFRTYLKGLSMSDDKLDAIVHKITAEVTAEINCRECARCCRGLNVYLDEKEFIPLAASQQMDISDFTQQFILTDEENDPYIPAPCPLLDGNDCSIYESRPKECQTYPYLMKERFRRRLFGVLANFEICPIVFVTVQRLKKELRYRPRRY